MMRSTGYFLRAAAAWTTTAALALSLAACSGQPEDNPSPDASTTAETTRQASPAATSTDPASGAGADSSHGPAPDRTSKPGPTGSPAPASGSKPPAGKPESGSAAGSTGPPVRNAEANARFVTVNNPSSLSVVVNKQRPLRPLHYAPSALAVPKVTRAVSGEGAQLRNDAAKALEKLFAAAAKDGINLTMLSGYRSYETQVATYNSWVGRLGTVAEADKVSARPGYSEHQTGLAVDIGVASGKCSLQYCFNNLPAASWAADNAYKFGYIVRYQLGYHKITGFYAEPWHLRFIGKQASRAMHRQDIHTLEKYFGLPAAPSY